MSVSCINNSVRGCGLLKRADLKGFGGFTLAEVLITLVIIGVIAAMTIPTLMNKTNNQELVSKLKKEYSTFSQATNKIISDYGMPRGDIGGWASSAEAVYNLYKENLNISKDCGSGTECFEKMTSGNTFYRYLKGTNYYHSKFASSDSFAVILADGAQVLFVNNRTDCSRNEYSTNNICNEIWVDINGEKKPNQWGRDMFIFALKENGLFPAGCDGDSSDCTKNGNGWSCACKVIKDNAMNY